MSAASCLFFATSTTSSTSRYLFKQRMVLFYVSYCFISILTKKLHTVSKNKEFLIYYVGV
jgi:hypothetical protein